MKVLITGSEGFIGKNFKTRIANIDNIDLLTFTRDNSLKTLERLVDKSDFIFHLAGINRSKNPSDFKKGNSNLTYLLCRIIEKSLLKNDRKLTIVYSSSKQASYSNNYGISKKIAEEYLNELKKSFNSLDIHILQIPNVFGKFSKPNYNSVVATFCYNISRELPIRIDDPSTKLSLIYIDTLIEKIFLKILRCESYGDNKSTIKIISPEFFITIEELAAKIYHYHNNRKSLNIDCFGEGLSRDLYSTYLSFLPKNNPFT